MPGDSLYAGVDYGTRKLAVALLDWHGGVVVCDSIELSQDERDVELFVLAEYLCLHLERHRQQIVTVAIESPLLGGNLNAQTLISMAMTAGAAMLRASQLGLKSTLVTPAMWKHNVLGPGLGNAGKDVVMDWAVHTWPNQHLGSQDEADALGLAWFAREREQ